MCCALQDKSLRCTSSFGPVNESSWCLIILAECRGISVLFVAHESLCGAMYLLLMELE